MIDLSKKEAEHQSNPAPDASEDQAANAVEQDLDTLIVKLTDERDAIRDQMLRTAADFQNFRKRVQQEKEQIRQTAIEGFVTDLLPVLDNFERTIAALQGGATLESLMEGVQLIERQLRTALEQNKVTRIPAAGAEFDPELHEAIGTDATEEVPVNTVTSELQAGYRLSDRVIRPARVKVAAKP
ncbi:MAG: nucleotide exchange factor GrpE [Fimbriimonadales bacterium]